MPKPFRGFSGHTWIENWAIFSFSWTVRSYYS